MPRTSSKPLATSLNTYTAKRDFAKTTEPPARKRRSRGKGLPRFVVQEHHASALHWDFRLEKDGVGPSWAVPKGIPLTPETNHLAVRVEDHPLDYFSYEGHIAEGQYGGGDVMIWDSGEYELEEWTDSKVKVVLHGTRVQGRYALFQTGGKNWMIHRMDPPTQAGFAPVPQLIRPMLAVTGELPGGPEVVLRDEVGRRPRGRLHRRWAGSGDDPQRPRGAGAVPRAARDGRAMGSTQAVLDGEIVAFDEQGRPSFGRLQQRMHVTKASALDRLRAEVPIHYLIFDVLHLDGRSLLDEPLSERRTLLESLGLAGDFWSTPGAFVGVDGADILAASSSQGLEGVVAKRLRLQVPSRQAQRLLDQGQELPYAGGRHRRLEAG